MAAVAIAEVGSFVLFSFVIRKKRFLKIVLIFMIKAQLKLAGLDSPRFLSNLHVNTSVVKEKPFVKNAEKNRTSKEVGPNVGQTSFA